jgi:hypothetical protein
MRRYWILAVLLVLALGTCAAAARRDVAEVSLEVEVLPHVQIEMLGEGAMYVSLNEPGDQDTTKMATRPFWVYTNATNVKIGFLNDDKFPALRLYDGDGNVIKYFKDPGNPEWSNPLKSDIQIRGGANFGTYKYIGPGAHREVLEFRAHWDNRNDLPWWNVWEGTYRGTVVLVVEKVS